MPKDTEGVEVKASVLAVNVSPNTALPLMLTVPLRVALSVVIVAGGLTGEVKCVAVSVLYASKVYVVLGDKPLKVVVSCQLPASLRYSQPAIAVSVMLSAVLVSNVGAAGVVWVALVMATVGLEVISPSQLTVVTVTVMVWVMSASTMV